jgi:hypothetical protein
MHGSEGGRAEAAGRRDGWRAEAGRRAGGGRGDGRRAGAAGVRPEGHNLSILFSLRLTRFEPWAE